LFLILIVSPDGTIDSAHAALAQFLDDLVSPNAPSNPKIGVVAESRPNTPINGLLEEVW